MVNRAISTIAVIAAAAVASATVAKARISDTIRVRYQKSSTLMAILKANGELEKALTPLGIRVSWHEFTSPVPVGNSILLATDIESGDALALCERSVA
jgi:sulfonate transport system substrate-binding protein